MSALRSTSTEAMITKAPDTANPPLYEVVVEVQFKRVPISNDPLEEEGWDVVDIDPVSALEGQKTDDNEKASSTTIPVPDHLAAPLASHLVQLFSQNIVDLAKELRGEISKEKRSDIYSQIDESRWRMSMAQEMGYLIKGFMKE